MSENGKNGSGKNGKLPTPPRGSLRTKNLKGTGGGGKGNPNSLANLQTYPKGTSGNPGGRPKLLGESYKEWLARADENGETNAQKVARAVGRAAAIGDVTAAREIRTATEGEQHHLSSWQTELVEALKGGRIKPQILIAEMGMADAQVLLLAAGLPIPDMLPTNIEDAKRMIVDGEVTEERKDDADGG